jgi:hypothetical protein
MMLNSDRPSIEASTMASGRNGITRNQSVNLIIAVSLQPP